MFKMITLKSEKMFIFKLAIQFTFLNKVTLILLENASYFKNDPGKKGKYI